MNDITFYQRFEADILAGRKTITIRDKSCTIEVLSVSPITLDELTEQHAKQENMGLEELKEVIRSIYLSEDLFYILLFKVL